MENLYLASIFGSLLFYIQVSMNYRFSNKYLNLLDKKDNYQLFPLAITFSSVCIFSACYYYSDPSEAQFGYFFLILMFCVVLAKYYYFNSLRIFLNCKLRFDRLYFYLVCFYAIVSLYYLYAYTHVGLEAFFDLAKPEASGNFLRQKLIPFEINRDVKILFIPNYLISQIIYIYLIVVSVKKKEFLIAFGVLFTTVSILYTNSYHIFQWSFWLPLNMVADLFEMFRLHSVQKIKLNQRIDSYNQKLSFVEQKLKDVEESKKIFKHDLNNKFTASNLNLYKAQTLISKDEFESKEKVLDCIENARTANKQAANFLKNSGLITGTKILSKTKEILSLFEIESSIEMMELQGGLAESKYDNILTNLVKNAYEANKQQEHPWVKIIGKQSEHEYQLKVIDSGLFQNISDPDRIFEANFTTKEKNTDEHGYGLTSVLNDIKSLNGSIKLCDFNGHTCFDITFRTAKLS